MAKKQDNNKSKKPSKDEMIKQLEAQMMDLQNDLQRTRADFENYRKRMEQEVERARKFGSSATILKLLPVIDNIERAISHKPDHLKDDKWAQGVEKLTKNLEKSLNSLGVERIEANPGTGFNPDYHEAVMSEDSDDGNDEPIIVEEIQAGYTKDDEVIRHSMVKVKN
jgi:molecular chaperone GrpE